MSERIEDLVAQGEQELARRRDEETARMEQHADRREEHWQALHAAATAALGADLVRTDRYGGRCPIDFRGKASSPWQFHLRPFGAAELLVRFECVRYYDDDAWQLEADGMAGKHTDREPDCAYRVCQAYHPCCTAPHEFEPQPSQFTNTADLAVAVALCKMQTDGYHDCVKLCKKLMEKPRADVQVSDQDTKSV